MTPKEKADELIYTYLCLNDDSDLYEDEYKITNEAAKKCALIAVNECFYTCIESMIYFWQEVKQEIEKL